MAANPVANISVDLAAKIAGFEANMAKATRSLSSSQKKMNRSLSRIEGGFKKLSGRIAAFASVAGAGLAVRALDNLARSSITAGDVLAKTADGIGVSIETLQELRFAAERSGGSVENLDKSLARYVKGVGEAKAGTGTLVTLLQKLDPDLLAKLLNAQTTDEALDLVFEKLRNTESAFEKNAIAAAAFGRGAGIAMIKTAEDADELSAKLRTMGGVLSEELARKAEEADDRLTDLDIVLQTRLKTAVLENIDGFVAFKTVLSDIELFFVRLASSVGNASSALGRFLRLQAEASDERGLRRERADTVLQIDAQQRRIEAINRRKESIFPGINQANRRNVAQAETEIAALTARIEEIDSQLARIERLKNAGQPPPTTTTEEESDGGVTGRNVIFGAPVRDEVLKTTDTIDRAAEATRRFELAGEEAGRGIADAFAGAIVFGERLDKTLARLAQRLAFEALANLFLKALPAAFGGTPTPGRAGGGRVAPGIATLVGERGPEIIVPQRAATIVNAADARRAGGAQVIVNQTIAPNFAGNAATQDDLRLMGQITREAAIAGTMAALRRPRFA
jgi:hypothetical protein